MANRKNFSYFTSRSAGWRFSLLIGLVFFFQCQFHLVAGSPNKVKADLPKKAIVPNACGTSGNTVCCTAESSSKLESTIVINSTGTHIRSPTAYTEPLQCRFQIPRKADVCQIRLDFITFEMAQPSSTGDCTDDVLTITGSDNLKNFQICGKNKDQHLYLHYGYSSMITLTTRLHAENAAVFDIVVTFVTCTDDEAAPAGCTQYFTESFGTVKSFNYEALIGPVADNQEQYQLNNQLYSACVEADPGSSEITWQTCTNGAFAISGMLPALATAARQGQACLTDYVDIPGGSRGARYCGTSFPGPVTSMLKPFMLAVNFDDVEVLGPNFEMNPVTGCCIFCVCTDGNTVVDNQPCSPPHFACELPANLVDRSDSSNIGFCLSYNVD